MNFKKRVKLKNDTKGEIKPSKYKTSDKKTQYAWENNNKKVYKLYLKMSTMGDIMDFP